METSALRTLLGILLLSALTSGDNLALLSGTLRTYQKASCDQEWMTLRCPPGTTLSINLAQYGRNSRLPYLCPSSSQSDLLNSQPDSSNATSCQFPNAIQTVVGLCQKKSSCKFQTSPQTFGGDPCPGIRKYVEVAFKCRPSEFKSVIGCEDEVIQLKCNRSSRLAIYSANYGRTEYESVQCPQPNGVAEESCLSSFATETVMQMCHGKRKCSLSADPATFGSPCKPESRMYLKVIYTCVPRRVLQEKYQGEPDPDEMFEVEEPEDDVADTAVVEQPSIYSPDHYSPTRTWPGPNNNNSSSSNFSSYGQTSTASDEVEDIGSNGTSGDKSQLLESSSISQDSHTGSNQSLLLDGGKSPASHAGVRIVYLVSQGINAYDFVSKNPDKFYLYVAISTALALLLIVILVLVRIKIQRARGRRRQEGLSSKKGGPSGGSSSGPILSSGLSDIDDLSLDLDANEFTTTTFSDGLPSILKKSSAFDRDHSESRKELRSPSHSLAAPSATLSRDNEVVRYSNTLGRKGKDSNNPRSFKPEAENEHLFYG